MGGILDHASTADFVKTGIEAELIGRIPVRVALRHLGENELLRVLTEARDSVVDQLVSDFDNYGIELTFTDYALREVARRAALQGTGARGLLTIMEQALRPFKFALPSTTVRSLQVDAQTIRRPRARLERVLGRPFRL